MQIRLYFMGPWGTIPKFYTPVYGDKCVTKSVECLGASSKILEHKKLLFAFCDFGSFSQNETRYRKSEKCVENHRHFARWSIILYFVSLRKKELTVVLTTLNHFFSARNLNRSTDCHQTFPHIKRWMSVI